MEDEKALDKVINEFNKIVDVIDLKLGKDYASKNPGMVQHLLDEILKLEDKQ